MAKISAWVLIAAMLLVVAAAAVWYLTDMQMRHWRTQELEPIPQLLQENAVLLRSLRADLGIDSDSPVLPAYLAKIRSDGVAKNASLKQRLDQLAENNSEITTRIDMYAPHAISPAFGAESNQFRHYSIAWRDRWNSVMELFMAGGNFPVAEVAFPKEFGVALQQEIESANTVFFKVR